MLGSSEPRDHVVLDVFLEFDPRDARRAMRRDSINGHIPQKLRKFIDFPPVFHAILSHNGATIPVSCNLGLVKRRLRDDCPVDACLQLHSPNLPVIQPEFWLEHSRVGVFSKLYCDSEGNLLPAASRVVVAELTEERPELGYWEVGSMMLS